MKYANLTPDERDVYDRAVLRSHRRRIEVRIFTLDDEFVQSLTPRFLSGEVTIDTESSPSRVATFDIIEPTRSLVFEPDEPGEASMHRKFKIQLVDSRQIMELDGEWVEEVVQYGPIWDFGRDGPVVHLEVDGTDRLTMGTVRKGHAWLRRTKMTDIIVKLLRAAGSRDNRIPDLAQRTKVHVHVGVTRKDGGDDDDGDGKGKGKGKRKVRKVRGFTTHRTDTYLGKATHLATALDRHLYPDAGGTFRLDKPRQRPTHHLTRWALLGDPQVARSTREGPNAWVVLGGKPKGSKRRVTSGLVQLPPGHPLDEDKLAWHDEPFRVLAEDTNPHIRSKKRARAIAVRRRDRAMRVLVDVSIDCLPIPHLIRRERDMVSADAPWGIAHLTMRQVTYPLGPDAAAMTIGAVRRSVPRRRMGSRGVA